MIKFLILFLLIANSAMAAIAIDTPSGSTSGTGVGAASLTFSHTATGGSTSVIFVNANSGTTGSHGVVTGITYNTVSLPTKVWAATESGLQYRTEGWYLLQPAAGAHNVVVTYTTGSGGDDAGAGAISFTGVDQTTVQHNSTTKEQTSATPSITITSATGDVVLATIATDSSTLTTTSPATEAWKAVNVGSDSSFGSSTTSGAASVSPAWAITSNPCEMGGTSIIPAAAGAVSITSVINSRAVINAKAVFQ